ncbi:Putative 30S ribosomal protein S6 [endosymbiont DhMRE of Dentiscutata heterogama]|uniref:30S ribosomal protein S6 n=1 Tax=endosymbiont DhMRE of Dentiscutata heterogama TaxID=1609546 RepID=UPI000629DAD5|nr:30S ribosomal protein S6 [endosymbiont DhMRE of Dentiscutata heterogama]CFW92928.1 Putative 30S ribosomal protein S6 [endosymbiont DhMRE of Dentiscutata heterogama]
MTKKKVNCRYELLCLLNEKEKNKEKYEKMIKNIQEILGKENITKVEEKDWKPAYKINTLKTGKYVLIYFNSARPQAKEMEKNVLQTAPKDFLNRYLLVNLEDEKKNKIKLINKKDKDAEQS